VTRAASLSAWSFASATIFLPSSRAVSRMRPASARASASCAVYSSSAASALRCASSAFAMLPSIASARSSRSFCTRGSTYFQKKTRMMTKQTADQMMS
jgi:hypothetical protein